MYKITVSIKFLLKRLEGLNGLRPQRARLIDNKLIVDAGDRSVSITCEFEGATAWLNQENRRWDWLIKLITALNGDAVVELEIGDNKLNMILDF